MAKHTRGGPPQNESEKWAIEFLTRNLPANYWVISNIDLTDQRGRPLEVDALVIGEWAVYLVEIKGYTGRVEAGERVWDLGSGYVEETPLKALGYKSRVLASRIRERITGYMHVPWCQATVFVTGNQGAQIDLVRLERCGSVCDASNIIETLTSREGLTAGHAFQLAQDQRDLVIKVLGQIGRLSEMAKRIQAFELGEEIYRNGGISFHFARLADDALERQFIIKRLESAAFSSASVLSAEKQRLRDEFRAYMELANVPGVPYVAPLIEDGEVLALPIGLPAGVPLNKIDPEDLTLADRVGVLESTARALFHMHRRCAVHAALQPQSIFVGDEHQVELLDLAAGHVRPNAFSAPELEQGKPAEASADIYSLGRIFENWFPVKDRIGGKSPEANRRQTDISDWIESSQSELTTDRPELQSLLDIITRVPALMKHAEPVVARIEPGGDPDGTGTYRLDVALGGEDGISVWRATHMHGYYPCALQIFGISADDQQDYLPRFREISSLVHPALARPLDIRSIPNQGRMFIATHWVEGQSLAQIVESGEHSDIESSLNWLRQLLTGLEYCHQKGVTHRNIMPASIVVSEEKAAFVEFSIASTDVDFGLPVSYRHPHSGGTEWVPEYDLYGLAGSFLYLWAGITPRDGSGKTIDIDGVGIKRPKALPESVWQGLRAVIDPSWSAPSQFNYLGLFGLQPPVPRLRELPAALRQSWDIRRGHQERLVCFSLRERSDPNKSKVRMRNQLATLTLRSERIPASAQNVASANAQISCLINQGVLEKRGKKSVALTTGFIKDARRFVG